MFDDFVRVSVIYFTLHISITIIISIILKIINSTILCEDAKVLFFSLLYRS